MKKIGWKLKMSKKSEEHHINYPNDIPHSPRYKKLLKKCHQINHKFSVSDISHRIKIMLQKEQIRGDTKIKDIMEEMFPHEYKLALQEMFDRHGMMKKQKVRRAELVKAWGIKPEKMPKWKG